MGDLLAGLRRFRVFRNGRCTPAPIALPQLDFLSDQFVDGRRFRIRVVVAPAQNAFVESFNGRAARRAPGGEGIFGRGL